MGERVGVSIDDLYTWSTDTQHEIIKRNPSLAKRKWVTVQHNSSNSSSRYRPFPIIETTLMGPFELVPFRLDKRQYVQSEFTPLYVGSPNVYTITYSGALDPQTHTIGGLVEPFVYGSGPPRKGLNHNLLAGLVNVTEPAEEFSIARFIA